MIQLDIPADVVLEASKLLESKRGTCEVLPKVRFIKFDNFKGFKPRLVCVHPDSTLNCGTGAESCDRCLNKEKAYEESRQFGQALGEHAQSLLLRINNKEKVL